MRKIPKDRKPYSAIDTVFTQASKSAMFTYEEQNDIFPLVTLMYTEEQHGIHGKPLSLHLYKQNAIKFTLAMQTTEITPAIAVNLKIRYITLLQNSCDSYTCKQLL